METIGIKFNFEKDVVLFDTVSGDIFYRRSADGSNARTIPEFENILSSLTAMSLVMLEGRKYEYDKTIKILLTN